MARTFKKGLDYFPLNVDFFNDSKVRLVEAEFGIKGLIVALRLLCGVYKEGYCYQWSDDECLLFSTTAGAGIVPGLVQEVVDGLVRRCFFDKGCYDKFKILTSRGIQNRYFDAVSRYKKVDVVKEFLLVDVSEMKNVNIIPINAVINPQNVNIGTHNESENVSVNVNENVSETPPKPHPSLSQVEAYFDEKGYSKSAAGKFFAYYEATGWRDKDGNPVKNWKLKAVNVWFRPEHEKPKPYFEDVAL
jgi:hypothetical protein